jgi:single-strand DNA-binding protein
MKAFSVARLGSDMIVKYLPNGDPVGEVSLAITLMKKDAEGKRMTQWIKAALFGKRAESLAPYLVKGSQHAFHLSELHIDSFTGKDGNTVSIMKARIDDV